MCRTHGEKGSNETFYGSRRDVECGCGEDEGGGYATACLELVCDDVEEDLELFEAEDDMALVGEVAIVCEVPGWWVVIVCCGCGRRMLEILGEV